MDWLLRLIGEHGGGIAVLLAFPFVVWSELTNFPPKRNRRKEV